MIPCWPAPWRRRPSCLTICRHLTAPGSILLLLTAGHLQDAFRGLAPDFLVRPVPTDGPKIAELDRGVGADQCVAAADAAR